MSPLFRPSSPRRADAVRLPLRLPATVALALSAGSALACGGGDGGDGARNPVDPSCVVSAVAVSPATAIVPVGQSATLTATITTDGCTAAPVAWTTSDAAVSTVSAAGVVTGVGAGRATLEATTGGRSDTVQVRVTDGRFGFAYSEVASPAIGTPYIPRLDFQRSPGGVPATVVRTGIGGYQVLFPNLSKTPGQREIAIASAVTSVGDDRTCYAASWGPRFGGLDQAGMVVNVYCSSAAGATAGNPADSPFTVQLVDAGALAGRHGFAWANDPASATYTPPPEFSANSTGGAVTITRAGTGQYRIRWAGLARPGGGAPETVVAAASSGTRRCNVASWTFVSADLEAVVQCTELNGSSADAAFVALVAEQGRPGRHYAVAAANRPTATIGTEYDAVTNGNSRSSAGGPITIRHTAVGIYLVHLVGLTRTGTSPETVMVTALGSTALCKVNPWSTQTDGTHVIVQCRAGNGAPVDTEFTLYLVE